MASTGDTWQLGRRSVLVSLVLLLTLAATFVLVSSRERSTAAEQTAAWCAQTAREAAAAGSSVVGRGRRVAVIGDSYSTGHMLARPEFAWPHYLAAPLQARVFVNGFGGSGFARSAGICRGESYLERVQASLAEHPDLVIVEGGLNDIATTDPGDVSRALERLAARVAPVPMVVVGPVGVPSLRGGAERIDRELATTCARLDLQYVSALDWQFPLLADGVHPTAAGHRLFGHRVAAAVTG